MSRARIVKPRPAVRVSPHGKPPKASPGREHRRGSRRPLWETPPGFDALRDAPPPEWVRADASTLRAWEYERAALLARWDFDRPGPLSQWDAERAAFADRWKQATGHRTNTASNGNTPPRQKREKLGFSD